LSKWTKSLGVLLAGGVFCAIAIPYADVRTNLSFTRWDSISARPLPTWLWIVWAVFIIYAMANGVNFADGLDGLAAGSSSIALSTIVAIGFWQFRHLDVYGVRQALDLTVLAIAFAGAIVGFLWWNAPPARIIMGDTGALAIGGGMAGLGLLMNIQLLLPVVSGLFVLMWLSNVIQIVSFRLFHRRVFKMAPLHHHFELSGWPETTVVIRFWILAGMFGVLALGIFYTDWVQVTR
jgi:phospho-N-acetylmuramoyl-pentapeptide-transferase